MHYLYILQSEKTGRYYVGVTSDIKRRLREHNSGSVRSTSFYKPWVIKRIEEYPDISSAYKRELFIKEKIAPIFDGMDANDVLEIITALRLHEVLFSQLVVSIKKS